MQSDVTATNPCRSNESHGHDLLRFGPGRHRVVIMELTFVGSETPFSAVAPTVGFGLERSEILYLSMGID